MTGVHWAKPGGLPEGRAADLHAPGQTGAGALDARWVYHAVVIAGRPKMVGWPRRLCASSWKAEPDRSPERAEPNLRMHRS